MHDGGPFDILFGEQASVYLSLVQNANLTTWVQSRDINGNGDGNSGFSDNDPVSTLVNMGSQANYTEATNPPTYKATGVGGKPSILFDGTNDLLNSSAISNHITASAFELYIAANAVTIGTASGNPYDNDMIWGSAGQYGGVHLHSTTPTVLFYNYDGNADSVSANTSTGATHVYHMRLDSGTLYGSVDGGSEVSVVTGNMSNTTHNASIGQVSSIFANIHVLEIAVFNAVQSAADRAANIAYMKWQHGV